MRTAKILIRLSRYPGWSESSLGAHAAVFVLSWGGPHCNAITACLIMTCFISALTHSRILYGLQQQMDRVKRIWYLSPMRAAKVQASRRIRAVSPEPPLLAHTSSESRGTFRQKARSLASLNGWACAVKTCRDGMLEDTNSLDGAQMNMVEKCYNHRLCLFDLLLYGLVNTLRWYGMRSVILSTLFLGRLAIIQINQD